MLVGALAPEGKLRLSSSWPSTDSTGSRKESFSVRSVEKKAKPAQQIASTAKAPNITRRGPAATRSPTRFQAPWVASERCSSLVRRSSKGVKTARSSGPTISDGMRPKLIRRSSQLRMTRGSRTNTSRQERTTRTIVPKALPSTIVRRARSEMASADGALSGVWGTKGQKARRPKIVSSAGSRVSIESAAQKMPRAPIGPRPAVPLTSAIIRHSRAAITVAAEARIAGPAEARAVLIASWRSAVWWSSSR